MKTEKVACPVCGHQSQNQYWHDLHMQTKHGDDRKRAEAQQWTGYELDSQMIRGMWSFSLNNSRSQIQWPNLAAFYGRKPSIQLCPHSISLSKACHVCGQESGLIWSCSWDAKEHCIVCHIKGQAELTIIRH